MSCIKQQPSCRWRWGCRCGCEWHLDRGGEDGSEGCFGERRTDKVQGVWTKERTNERTKKVGNGAEGELRKGRMLAKSNCQMSWAMEAATCRADMTPKWHADLFATNIPYGCGYSAITQWAAFTEGYQLQNEMRLTHQRKNPRQHNYWKLSPKLRINTKPNTHILYKILAQKKR